MAADSIENGGRKFARTDVRIYSSLLLDNLVLP